MDLLAKADEIINPKPTPWEEYKEKVKDLHLMVNSDLLNIPYRKTFLEAFDKKDMLKIASLSWLLTWSASMRWTTLNESQRISEDIMKQYNEVRTLLRSTALQKTVKVKDIISSLQWLEEFIKDKERKDFKNYYHYEIITYLNEYKMEDNWSNICDTDKIYIWDFIKKMDAKQPHLKEHIESFLDTLHSV